jgi:hypothetical protein
MAYDQQLADAVRENEALRAALAQLQQAVMQVIESKLAAQSIYDDLDDDGRLGHLRHHEIRLSYNEIRQLRALVVPKE